MRVLLDVTAVAQPLSGIGRYALELARYLPQLEQVEELVYLRGEEVLRDFDGTVPPAAPQAGVVRSALRAVLPYKMILGPFRHRKAKALARQLGDFAGHVFFSPNFSLPPVAGAKAATIHDLSVFHFPEFHPRDRVRYLQDQIQSSVASADLLVTDSSFIRGELLELFGVSPDKVVTVPLGVDESYHPRPLDRLEPVLGKYDIEPGSYLLSVGTVEPRKNLPSLLSAFQGLDAELRRKYPLVVVGAYGWHEDSLMRQMQTLQARGELRYLDYVPEGDLPAIYAGATAFCYFSFYEGFGLPVLEAMSSGVPVLAADTSALPELCGDCALLANPAEVESIQGVIERGLQDEEWRNRVSRSGRERSLAYRWPDTAAALAARLAGLAR